MEIGDVLLLKWRRTARKQNSPEPTKNQQKQNTYAMSVDTFMYRFCRRYIRIWSIWAASISRAIRQHANEITKLNAIQILCSLLRPGIAPHYIERNKKMKWIHAITVIIKFIIAHELNRFMSADALVQICVTAERQRNTNIFGWSRRHSSLLVITPCPLLVHFIEMEPKTEK